MASEEERIERLRQLKARELGERPAVEQRPRKKKAKGPNPLSCQKKKKKPQATAVRPTRLAEIQWRILERRNDRVTFHRWRPEGNDRLATRPRRPSPRRNANESKWRPTSARNCSDASSPPPAPPVDRARPNDVPFQYTLCPNDHGPSLSRR